MAMQQPAPMQQAGQADQTQPIANWQLANELLQIGIEYATQDDAHFLAAFMDWLKQNNTVVTRNISSMYLPE
jgi:predicted GTPase